MKFEPGQVAVVTGGASGIGLAMARAFGAQGLKLVLGDIEQSALAAAAKGLLVDGFDVATHVVDVASEQAMDEFADAAFADYGGVNVLCNNAGVVARHDSWGPLDDWRWVLGVDLWGVVHGVHAFVPRMLEAATAGQQGHIVNTASVAGLLGFPGIASYTAAKHAVVGLSTSMHHELAATNIGVSVLCPGLVATNIVNSERNRPGVDPEYADADNPSYALTGEALTPDDVADQVVTAIGEDRFWILPHSHYADQAIDLAQGRKAGEPPAPPQVRF